MRSRDTVRAGQNYTQFENYSKVLLVTHRVHLIFHFVDECAKQVQFLSFNRIKHSPLCNWSLPISSGLMGSILLIGCLLVCVPCEPESFELGNLLLSCNGLNEIRNIIEARTQTIVALLVKAVHSPGI